MLNFMPENTFKRIIGTIVCCTGLAFGMVNAEDSSPAEDPSLWDKTKETSGETWDATKETSGEAWDATKEGSAKAWDATKETSGEAWDATKEGSKKAWDGTKEVFTDSDTPEEAPADDNTQQ